jgi:uncharacterized protein (DUF427 family)
VGLPGRSNTKPPANAGWKGAMAMRAIWTGRVLADRDETVVVQGRHYFPPDRHPGWHHPGVSAAAERLSGHVAFWHGVRVERSGPPSVDGERVGFLRRLLGAKVGAARS